MDEPSHSACDFRHSEDSKTELHCLCSSEFRNSFQGAICSPTSGIYSSLLTDPTSGGQNTSAPSPQTESSLFDSVYSSHYTSEDFHLREPIAEIELVSITQPCTRIPRYRLRVDPCTAFIGYKHKDFSGARRATRHLNRIHSLPLKPSNLTTIPSENLSGTTGDDQQLSTSSCSSTEPDWLSDEENTPELTIEQIEQTLDYFLLCGLRVSQMTRTYEDLDAITHLLEEKQNDLELAAKIGKTLLDKNQDLERRLSDAERKLVLTEETVNQLRHTLSIKDSLLQIYSRDHQDDAADDHTTISSGCMSPLPGAGQNSDSGEGFSLASVNFSHLNRRVRELEEENFILREERNRLNATADQLDEHEGALIRDCARQLVSANMHIRTLSDELSKRSDAFLSQQSEVTRLLTRGLDLENKVKHLASENDMLSSRLNESQLAQQRVSNELCQLRDKYDECMSLFTEARAEIRVLRKRSRRAYLRSGCVFSSNGLASSNSLSSTPTTFLPTSCSIDQPVMPSPLSLTLPTVSDESSSSPDLSTQQSNLDACSLASDIALTARKEHAADNVDRLLRVMDQVRCTREHGVRVNTLVPPQEYGPEDTVSSSGFVSGSEPSERVSRSTLSGNLHPGRQPVLGAVSSTSSGDAFLDHLPDENSKRHSWFGSVSVSHDSDIVDTRRAGNCALTHHDSLEETILPSDPSKMYGLSSFRSPQRLELLKLLDGSEVLQQWQWLATPSITRALFEAPLPGVQSRAEMPPSVHATAPLSSPLHAENPTSGSTHSTPLRSVSSIRTARSGNNHTQSPSLPSNDSSRRFGANLPAHLTVDGVRSRSMESLCLSTCRPQRHLKPDDNVNLPEVIATSTSSSFCIPSLFSLFSPFSLPFRTALPDDRSSFLTETKQVSSEPVRIRPRSPQRSRGLLDVSKIGFDSAASLQHVATAVQSNPSVSVNLPAAQPPPTPPHLYARPPPSRTIRTSSLSGILEESGSPPKLDDTSAGDATKTTP